MAQFVRASMQSTILFTDFFHVALSKVKVLSQIIKKSAVLVKQTGKK